MLDGPVVPSCPLDGASLRVDPARLRDNRFGLSSTIQIAWCPSCGLGMTVNPPSQQELDSLYANFYDSGGEAQIPGTSRAARIWHRVNGSLALADDISAGPVLDVGCHTGDLLATLQARGLKVVGLEPNPEAAAAVRSKGIDVIEEPLESAGLPQSQFRTVVLSQVLEHLHDPSAMLDRVHETIRRDGRVYAAVPNAGSVWRHLFGPNWAHWHVPFHLWHFSPKSLALLFATNGFAVESLRTITPGEWLLMSMQARRNARQGIHQLESFRGRFGRRLAVAPAARLSDFVGYGDALYAVVRPI
jgi:2-polyprenyl-3-methyl-5-hydroxy-6-metoxy-1,4-benzoquinol methylase